MDEIRIAPEEDSSGLSVYLVSAEVTFVGGGRTVIHDVFEAPDADMAQNIASNHFIGAGECAVYYGDTTVFPGVVSSVKVEVLATLDMSHPDNDRWVKSIAAAKEWEKDLRGTLTRERDEKD